MELKFVKLSLANFQILPQLYPFSFITLSTDRLHVSVGLHLFLFPSEYSVRRLR